MTESEIRRVNLRRTHPTFFYSVASCGVFQILHAFNFWGKTPAFNPYDIPKALIGVIFFVLGVLTLLFLIVRRDLPKLRLVIAVAAGFQLCWGIINTQQALTGPASFQLPLFVLNCGVLEFLWSIESPVNPMTKREP